MVGMSHFCVQRIENTLQIYAKNGLVPNFSGKNAANGQKKRKKTRACIISVQTLCVVRLGIIKVFSATDSTD